MAGGLDFKGALVGIRVLPGIKHAESYLQKCKSQGVQSMKDVESIPCLVTLTTSRLSPRVTVVSVGRKMSLFRVCILSLAKGPASGKRWRQDPRDTGHGVEMNI